MSWLLAATWKGSLLVGMALAVHALLRNRISPRWRHALLLVAMLRLLLPVAPAAPFSIFNLTSAVKEPAQPRLAPRVVPALPPSGIVRRAPMPADRPSPAIPLLVTLWAAGALIVVCRVAFYSLRLRRRLREDAVAKATPVAPELLDLLDLCRGALEIGRQVRLVPSNVVDTPALHGLLRPAVLIPTRILETFTADQLRFIFLHELGHLRRADVLLNWITTAIQALHWFNPLVWIAIARMNEERELACDALALAALDRHERGAYGETVLQILDRFRAPSLAPGLIGMSATKQQMKRRIQMIAKFRTESRRAGLFGVVVAALALVTLTDASAGEKKTLFRRAAPLTPEAKAVMERLDQTIDLDLSAKSIDEVVNAVSNRTGVRLSFAADAIDASGRQAEITLKAKNLAAHVVLIETLSAFDLGLDFTAEGASIVKMPQRERFKVEIPALDGGEVHEDRVIIVGPGQHDEEMEARRFETEDEDTPAPGKRVMIKKMNVSDVVENGKDGVIRRQMKIRGSEEGQPEGTLELEVKRTPASSAR